MSPLEKNIVIEEGDVIDASGIDVNGAGGFTYTLPCQDVYGTPVSDSVPVTELAEENAAPVADAGGEYGGEIAHDCLLGGCLDINLDASASRGSQLCLGGKTATIRSGLWRRKTFYNRWWEHRKISHSCSIEFCKISLYDCRLAVNPSTKRLLRRCDFTED